MNKERVLLICCEGKETECQYFNAIKNQYRISQGSVRVKVIGGLGQHKRLIDESVVHRTQLVERYGLCDEDIEVWAVCDNDDMSIAYTDLLKYAKENSVKLAFSDPAFEIYLLQHFGFRASTANRAELNLKDLIPVALKGRVMVKVKGKVEIGDVIVASDEYGIGVVDNSVIDRFAMVGKAIESSEDEGVKKIKILIR